MKSLKLAKIMKCEIYISCSPERDWNVKKTSKFTSLKTGVAPVVLGMTMLATPALAQEASADASDVIVVTGSRIPQPNLEGPSPVTTVSAQDLKLQGVTRVEDMLNSLPQVFAGQASTLSNGATGTATVDLRGLGSTRTLVLVNGRRLMPGDPSSSAADLNAVPEFLVKRVEVLTGGASSTYGADAVAGVVNFIMDRDFTGLRADAQYSFYQHSNSNDITPPLLDARRNAGFSGFDYPTGSVTDGETVNASLGFGTKFADDRGHLTTYFSYRKVKPVLQSNRDYSACTIQNRNATDLQCGGSSTSAPGNALIFEDGGTSSTFYQIGPDRTLIPGRTRYNFAPTNYYQRPDERYSAGFFADYEISDAVKPYMEFMFMDDRSVAQIAPSGDFGNTLSINCDNPTLSAQALETICNPSNLITGFLGTFPLTAVTNPDGEAGPVDFIDPTTGETYNRAFFQLLRRNVEGGPRQADLQHTAYRGTIGVKGDLSPAWSYDAYYQYGRTNYGQTYSNEFSVARLTNALDIVEGPNGPICRVTRAGTDPNCVPYDLFSGQISQAALNYVSGIGFQRGTVSEQIASGSITGLLGEYGVKSPWSDNGVAINVGAEYRRSSLDLKTDTAFQTGDLTGQGAPTLPISGRVTVKELFGEASVPIVSDSFIKDMTFTTGYRHSSYDVNGAGVNNSFKTDTYKFGLELAPISDIRFRAGYNRAVRAPNIQELFAATFVGLSGSSDPCAGFTITADDVGCLAQGLSVGQKVTGNPAGQYNALLGGNPNLKPEKATTKSFGVIFQPGFLPRFSMTVDYFDIKVKNAIQAFGADAIVNDCANTARELSCSLVNRNPVSGSLWLDSSGYITNLPSNIGGVHTAGVDVNANYSHEVGKLGTVAINLIGTYLDKYVVDNGLSEVYDCAGLYGSSCGVPAPKWRHKARLSWNLPNGIGLSGQWRYFGGVDIDFTSPSATLAGNYDAFNARIGAKSYFDLTATFKFADKFKFTLGANNILDSEPPLVGSGRADGTRNPCGSGCNGNTYPAVYDALGRYIYAGVSFDF
ncbi:MAG: TonB-dependent receptor plug domain-containing protein [Chakrabartia sp.]